MTTVDMVQLITMTTVVLDQGLRLKELYQKSVKMPKTLKAADARR